MFLLHMRMPGLITIAKSNSDVVSCRSLHRISLDEECIMRVVDCPDCDCRMSWKLLEDHKQPHGLHQVWLIPAIGSIEEMRRTRLKWSEVKKQEVVVNDLIMTWFYLVHDMMMWLWVILISFSWRVSKAEDVPFAQVDAVQLPRNECENRAATCESCGMSTTYRKLQTHVAEECPESLGCRPFSF